MPPSANGTTGSQRPPANEPASFPNSTDINEHNRPISRGSDFTEYDDNPPPATDVPSLPVTPAKFAVTAGEQSRPGTANTGNSRGNWSSATPYQKTFASYAGSTGAASNRPPTAGSRTHVPSLTAHAFHRPMSSQRLQAQRSARSSGLPTTQPPSRGAIDGSEDERKATDSRPSSRPNTGRKTPGASRPISRGTDITEFGPTAEEDDVPAVPSLPDLRDLPDRATANASPGSEAPLHLNADRSPTKRPSRLNLDRVKDSTIPTELLTPRSFRSGVLKSNRHSRTSLHGGQGHTKLPSDASTFQAKEATKDIVKRNLGKNYEYFPGNTTFCLGGRLQNTRDRPINIATGILIILPAALFFAYSGVYYWREISPAVPIIFAYLFLICFSSFWHASVTDPGILPRNLHPFPPSRPDDDPLTIGPSTVTWTLVKSANASVDAMEVPSKFCKTCDIWRPPRTHHCRTCDNCVETQDHHCVWLNNCVGRRNYRYFFTFVSSASLLGFFLFGASLAHVLVYQTRQDISFGASANANRVPTAMFVYGIIAGAYPLALVAYHLWLMARGETTRETMQAHKFAPADRHRPYTQGSFFRNWIAVLVRPRPPTYLRFKSAKEEGDRRFGESKKVWAEKSDKTGRDVEMTDVKEGER